MDVAAKRSFRSEPAKMRGPPPKHGREDTWVPQKGNAKSTIYPKHGYIPAERSSTTTFRSGETPIPVSRRSCETEVLPTIVRAGEARGASAYVQKVSPSKPLLAKNSGTGAARRYVETDCLCETDSPSAMVTPEETVAKLQQHVPLHGSDLSDESTTSQQEQALVQTLGEPTKEIKRSASLADALAKLPEAHYKSFLVLCYVCLLLVATGSKITAKEMAAISLRHGQNIAQTLFGLEHGDYKDEAPLCSSAVKDKSTSHFLAAVYLLTSSAMSSLKFVLHVLPEAGKDGWQVLKFIFGLAGSGFVKSNKGLLTSLVNILGSSCIPQTQPVVKNPEFLYLLACLHESKDANLCRQLSQEFLHSQTVVFSAQDVETNAQPLAMFVSNSLPADQYWMVYTFGGGKKISIFKKEVKMIGGVLIYKELEGLEVTEERNLVIITTRNLDYLRDTVSPLLQARAATDGVLLKTLTPLLESSVYGHLSRERYETLKKLVTTSHFNIVKDLLSPHLTMLCMQEVPAQYRKNDHIWFHVQLSLRRDWYDAVRISPSIPVHWVKVPQPNGLEDLEKEIKKRATAAPRKPTSSSAAELVLLNSQPLNLVEVVVPDRDPVTVLVRDQDETEDQGYIGCDFLMDKYLVHNAVTFQCRPFDIKRDEKIGRCLPLPSQKLEMGESTTLANTALANTPQGQLEGHQGKGHTSLPRMPRQDPSGMLPATNLGRMVPRESRPYVELAAAEKAVPPVSEHEIKKEAMNGFDRPGHCFYGDQLLFKMGMRYPLPDTHSTCRILREGGNGTILEFKYGGKVYAVKKTAFRWREVLIMPKLKHRNILKLVALIIGDRLENHPKRRYVYHMYPKLKNDLGRSVGSFEKHCLRTLMERYQAEPLLLNKIKSNFRHVARELLFALDYLHSLPVPIVHRDVKTSNILIRMACDCHNPLVCVCRDQPGIILGDFDASLELSKDGTLEPDPPRASSSGFHPSSMEKVYHVSAVGTIGYKSPEGSMYMIGNDLETMPPLTTKADIFSYGLVMSLLFLNQEGPKYQRQMSQLVLSVNQTVGPGGQLSQKQKEILKKNKIHFFRPTEIVVTMQDIAKFMPTGRAKRDFAEDPAIINFLENSLAADPKRRWSARQLLSHTYLIS